MVAMETSFRFCLAMEGFDLPMFDLSTLPVIVTGSLGSLVTGLLTGVGALPIFFRARWGRTSQVILLAVAAGVMLAATVFSLVIPAMDIAALRFGSRLIATLIASGGIALGALSIWLVHSVVPHQHFEKGKASGKAVGCPF